MSRIRIAGLFTLIVLVFSFTSTTQGEDAGQEQPEASAATPEPELDDETPVPPEMDDGELEGGDHKANWNYSDQSVWPKEYPICNGAKNRQSPINIETDKVVLRKDLVLELIDYDQEVEFEIKNTHHTVSMVPIPSLANPTLRLGWLAGEHEFELQEVHFHWGNATNKGSEHEIDGQRTAAEMHMVHYRKGVSKTDIGSIENSVVVIGVMIESISKFDEPTLDPIVENVRNVNGTDEEFKSEPSPLINLLPASHHSFFTYNGSLTTPPCYEVVTWIVMHEPVRLSPERLNELMNIEANLPGGRRKISSNHREVQPLIDRKVFASYSTTESSSVDENKKAHEVTRFSKAFETYWSKVRVSGTIRKAFKKKLEPARKKLLLTIKKLSKESDKKP